jgi:hypothetical protein
VSRHCEGIHFNADDLVGKEVGNELWLKAPAYFEGKIPRRDTKGRIVCSAPVLSSIVTIRLDRNQPCGERCGF